VPLSVQYANAYANARVGLPGAKNWWRNFLSGGGPITLRLNGTD
jgi:hypothetical protein